MAGPSNAKGKGRRNSQIPNLTPLPDEEQTLDSRVFGDPLTSSGAQGFAAQQFMRMIADDEDGETTARILALMQTPKYQDKKYDGLRAMIEHQVRGVSDAAPFWGYTMPIATQDSLRVKTAKFRDHAQKGLLAIMDTVEKWADRVDPGQDHSFTDTSNDTVQLFLGHPGTGRIEGPLDSDPVTTFTPKSVGLWADQASNFVAQIEDATLRNQTLNGPPKTQALTMIRAYRRMVDVAKEFSDMYARQDIDGDDLEYQDTPEGKQLASDLYKYRQFASYDQTAHAAVIFDHLNQPIETPIEPTSVRRLGAALGGRYPVLYEIPVYDDGGNVIDVKEGEGWIPVGDMGRTPATPPPNPSLYRKWTQVDAQHNPTALAAKGRFQYQAGENFTAAGPGEVSMTAGDTVYVVDANPPTNHPGWWLVNVGGQEGLVPSNHVDFQPVFDPTYKPLAPSLAKGGPITLPHGISDAASVSMGGGAGPSPGGRSTVPYTPSRASLQALTGLSPPPQPQRQFITGDVDPATVTWNDPVSGPGAEDFSPQLITGDVNPATIRWDGTQVAGPGNTDVSTYLPPPPAGPPPVPPSGRSTVPYTPSRASLQALAGAPPPPPNPGRPAPPSGRVTSAQSLAPSNRSWRGGGQRPVSVQSTASSDFDQEEHTSVGRHELALSIDRWNKPQPRPRPPRPAPPPPGPAPGPAPAPPGPGPSKARTKTAKGKGGTGVRTNVNPNQPFSPRGRHQAMWKNFLWALTGIEPSPTQINTAMAKYGGGAPPPPPVPTPTPPAPRPQPVPRGISWALWGGGMPLEWGQAANHSWSGY